MSNDSPHENTDPEKPEKAGRKPPIRPNEATETDLWDLEPDETPSPPPRVDPPAAQPTAPAEKPTAPAEKAAPEPEAPKDETPIAEGEEPAPKVALPSVASITSLSMVEKIAVSSLFAALALGATLVMIHFSNEVPTRPIIAEEIDYPVKGEIVEITEASTYWRAPVTTGEDTDVVRRGTKLIPVLKLKLSSKSGAIRVFFRNEDGIVVGDGITRSVNGDAEISVAATAGFDDVGMHTAYRMEEGKEWVVQVFEGPDATAPREKFRRVLETEISTEIR